MTSDCLNITLSFFWIYLQSPVVYNPSGEFKIIAVDCGIKYNQIRCLIARGAAVKVVPWNYDFNNDVEKGGNQSWLIKGWYILCVFTLIFLFLLSCEMWLGNCWCFSFGFTDLDRMLLSALAHNMTGYFRVWWRFCEQWPWRPHIYNWDYKEHQEVYWTCQSQAAVWNLLRTSAPGLGCWMYQL